MPVAIYEKSSVKGEGREINGPGKQTANGSFGSKKYEYFRKQIKRIKKKKNFVMEVLWTEEIVETSPT